MGRSTRHLLCAGALATLATLTPLAQAQIAVFTNYNNGIYVPPGYAGASPSITIESRFLLNEGTLTYGSVLFGQFGGFDFNNQMGWRLATGLSASSGLAYKTINGLELKSNTALSPCAWTHLAYVGEPTTERLYINGTLVATRARDTTISNLNSPGYIGRGTTAYSPGTNYAWPGLIGAIDYVRVSKSARYTANFIPPTGTLASDANTILLYNFNELAGATSVIDSSGYNRHGIPGPGGGITAPTFGVKLYLCAVRVDTGPILNHSGLVRATAGQPVSISVDAHALEELGLTPTYTWYKNNEPLGPDTFNPAPGPTRFIPAAHAGDSGQYMCLVQIPGSPGTPGTPPSEPEAMFTEPTELVVAVGACNSADVTDGSGAGAPDGLLTGSDVVRFFQAFFTGCP